MSDVRFIADVMLGKLARRLRQLGVDVRYSNAAADHEIVIEAEREERVILTRDHGLSRRRMRVPCLVVESDDTNDQLVQVSATYDLKDFVEFSRCLECNTLLEPVSREEVRTRVPALIYDGQQAFSICHSCERVYWPGIHVARMRTQVRTRR